MLAVRYVLVVTLAGVAGAAGLQLVLLRPVRVNFRVLAAMGWLPALALFVSHVSILAALASMAVGWNIAKAGRARRVAKDDGASPDGLFRSFAATDSSAFAPSLAAACAAVCAEGGVWAATLDHPIAAAAMFGIGAAAWARTTNRQRAEGDAEAGGLRVLAPVGLAFVLTLVGLMQYAVGGNSDSDVARNGQAAGRDSAKEQLGGTYRGIILVPEPAPKQVVAPTPPADQTRVGVKKTDPFSIPFSGVYWMYRFPQKEPPAGSYVTKGTPLTSVFRTSDRFPLSVEARQHFGSAIDLSCCGKIQVVVRTSDVHARSITLELILRDTTSPGSRPLTLGTRAVLSGFDPLPVEHGAPVEAVLTYEVPRGAAIKKFDEATIRFNAYRMFATASPKVAIDRFIFVPRGI